jgi:hypothetical protein
VFTTRTAEVANDPMPISTGDTYVMPALAAVAGTAQAKDRSR